MPAKTNGRSGNHGVVLGIAFVAPNMTQGQLHVLQEEIEDLLMGKGLDVKASGFKSIPFLSTSDVFKGQIVPHGRFEGASGASDDATKQQSPVNKVTKFDEGESF